MARSYEELVGPRGRAIYFRPERRRVRDLLSREADPHLVVGGREFPLFDISMNGLSFTCRENPSEWHQGQEIDVALLLFGKQVYTGRGRIARVQAGPKGGARIGMGLEGGFLDLPRLCRLDEDERLELAFTAGPEAVREKIPRAYQEAVGRAVFFVQFYRQVLDRREARCREDGDHGGVDDLAVRALGAMREPWNEVKLEAAKAAQQCLGDRDVMLAAKEYTETLLTPLLLDAPLMRRAYTKPLGYPGDYQVMLYYYDNALEGNSLFGRVFHKLGVEHPLSHGVRTRKDFIVEIMEREHQRVAALSGERAVYRVASLGCGPAREVSDYIAGKRGWPGQATWTLIDQEEKALSVAFAAANSALSRLGGNGKVQCLNVSFPQLLADPTHVPIVERQHLYFATGLVDYLRESVAQALVRRLYDDLEPGGLLVIGNAIAPTAEIWSPEFVLDWTLLYRTREEMTRLAVRLPESAEVKVAREPGNAYYFLLARKR